MRFVPALLVAATITSATSLASAQTTIAECGYADSDGNLCVLWYSNVTGEAYVLEDNTSPWTGQEMQPGEQFFVTGTVDVVDCFSWCGVTGGCVVGNVNSVCPEDFIGIRSCFGDGTTIACPCGNESGLGAEEGCEHGGGIGATLYALGSDAVADDDLEFTVQRARANQPGVLVQGATSIAAPFKDGILCAGAPTVRLESFVVDAAGEGTNSLSVVTEGNVAPGDSRIYQFWFRDPVISPCGTASNFSSAVEIDWR